MKFNLHLLSFLLFVCFEPFSGCAWLCVSALKCLCRFVYLPFYTNTTIFSIFNFQFSMFFIPTLQQQVNELDLKCCLVFFSFWILKTTLKFCVFIFVFPMLPSIQLCHWRNLSRNAFIGLYWQYF